MADFTGTTGDDTISGTAGNDDIFGAAGNDQLFGHDGNDTIDGGAGSDSIDGGNGNDLLYGGMDGNDTLKGGVGNDGIEPGSGNDSIDGGSGWDYVSYLGSPSGVVVDLVGCTVTGGDGNDIIFNVEEIFGSLSDDLITGDALENDLHGEDGDDTLAGGDGNDYLDGYSGDDILSGGNGDDTLYGSWGNDTLDGGANGIFGDTASFFDSPFGIVVNLNTGVATDGYGSGSTDTLIAIEHVIGTASSDSVIGNNATNWFHPGAGNDTFDGGGGRDVVMYEEFVSGVTINLLTGNATGSAIGTDTLVSVEAAHGSFANDTITLSNTTGGYVFAFGGNDSLVGGTGDDNFHGGSGNDTMTGGAGFDTVSYDSDFSGTPTGLGVTVNLITGTATDNWGNTDTFTDAIELVNGSPFADMLIGGNPINGSALTDGFEGFTGNAGNDTINGGAGWDRAYYTTSPVGVNVTLGGNSNGTATDGFGGIDVLISITEVRGSDHGDVLTGSSDNVFESFEGRAGNDTINGMGGTDRVNYQTGGSGVSVNLTAGTASDSYSGTDFLSNIENIRGTDFNDSLTGDGNANDIEGRLGNDLIQGLLGEDFLRGGAGNDTIDGGVTTIVSNTASSNNEYDTATYSDATSAVTVILGATGTAGTATGGGLGNDVLIGIERVIGSIYGDVISGTDRALNEIITGGLGNDTLSGGAGGTDLGFSQVDYRDASGAVNVNIATGVASGANGDDVLSGFLGILSGLGNDVLTGNSSDNFFYGGLGNDTISGGAGNDRSSYHTAPSAVTVNLTTGTSSGGGGNDRLISIEHLRGSEHADTLTGDKNSNDFQAREGNDTVSAGSGEDTVYGGLGNDSMDGGSNDPVLGYDWLGYSTASGSVTVNLLAGTSSGAEGNDTFVNFEAVLGSAFADTITGDAGDNVLRGNGGNDTIDGGAGGNDWIDYASAPGSVTVSLVTQTSSG
ncbi:MAG TPA: calcium-binding protein, partial [Ramlibacter sp.]|nr:calcium-binding protein [Ramlibacter sp.]